MSLQSQIAMQVGKFRISRWSLLAMYLVVFLLSTFVIRATDSGSISGFISDYYYIMGELSWLKVIASLAAVLSTIGALGAMIASVRASASSEQELQKALLERSEGSEHDNESFDFFSIRGVSDDYFETVMASLQDDWRRVFILGRKRLIDEKERLSARSTLNLAAGVSISTVGVMTLVYIIVNYEVPLKTEFATSILVFYGPRISLVILIQLLAAFFLRMYVGNERDIRKNNNEITNLELRLAAGMLAQNSPKTKDELALKLICEERNFVLNKREKSVPLDNTKDTSVLLNSLHNLIKSLKP